MTTAEMISAHRLTEKPPLYLIGSFDRRVTVLAQQTRALNLAWAMIETEIVPTRTTTTSRVAVVGAGFAGLTFAAALLRKGSVAAIDVFEQRDSLLPLQQGSDTRWLHPHIYDWPKEGSEAAAAMLPILNWTAARSSDVVVQVLGEWAKIAADREHLRVFCNARHLQITGSSTDSRKARIEWVGEERHATDGRILGEGAAQGMSETYDAVVLSVGFGLEAGEPSYWRNETLGQPNLEEARRTYLLSGQGDGAMIDLLRIRISQFRQDRILDELFVGRGLLLERLRDLRNEFLQDETGLFDKFERLVCSGAEFEKDMAAVVDELSHRLRRDTDVVLQLKVRNVADLLEPNNSGMSFQNALLVYLLYRCGGFSPTTESERAISARFGIPRNQVVRRHGVKPLAQIGKSLPPEVHDKIAQRRKTDPDSYGLQQARSHWPGGYFGFEGTLTNANQTTDDARRQWRKEYLPGPTALLATTISGSIAGAISRMRPNAEHFRVTLHRTLSLNGDDLLQQACDYVGKGLLDASATAGRTIVASALTIGAAYQTRKIVRTPRGIARQNIQIGMEQLQLGSVARKMREDVSFVFAMPVIQPDNKHFAPSPVAAVLYFDSRDADFWLKDTELAELALIVESAVRAIDAADGSALGRVRNFAPGRVCNAVVSAAKSDTGTNALEIVSNVKPPSTTDEFVLNYDHSDLAPVSTKSTTQSARNLVDAP
ncbi:MULTISPECIES: FAD/NAD(P)-binding protein [unclassified Mesorhizobium]|uniref:NAD(P)-binding protein n=1 Tax=unclassified Mesorhizobium TaxID=325217 RepID=UPI0018DC6202|nr:MULTISPECIES: FAD/NAD(P)-binding protein [unclassified Mesorhizobium]WJI76984.1 NAD(P)-binding protein [Mesorhizobium sp. C395A]